MTRSEAVGVTRENSEIETNAALGDDQLEVVSHKGAKRPFIAIDATDSQATEVFSKKIKQEKDMDDLQLIKPDLPKQDRKQTCECQDSNAYQYCTGLAVSSRE